jgi:hypothetical protein
MSIQVNVKLAGGRNKSAGLIIEERYGTRLLYRFLLVAADN